MRAIQNATLVMKDHYILNAVVLIDNGRIAGWGETRTTPIPADCEEVIDAQGLFVGPGFVDIHTHSDGKVFFQEDPVTAAQHHLEHGTTTVLPALYTGLSSEQYVQAAAILREAMKKPECGNIAGLYMEGPYLNPGFGCDRVNNPWAGDICKEMYQPVIDACWDLAKVWCVAPEREGILAYIQAVKEKSPHTTFAVAHSAASPQQVEALIPYGLRIGTHHTNATGDRPRYPECRGVCVDEAVNYNDSIYAELICDSMGIHVDPYMLRLVRKIKGDDRIILISDAYACNGPIPSGYESVDDINFDWEGEIAGSKMTLDAACRNMMKHTGASIVDIFKYASYNPARATGMLDRGEIAVGKRADLVITDHWMNIKHVILKGELQK